MMTFQEREKVRGTMQPNRLSEDQLRGIADTLRSQAEEYYALADKVANDAHSDDAGYHVAVAKYYRSGAN